MAITANQVKDLRERTGLGMMECKSALTETNGDMDAAIELLRKKAGAKVEKKSGRTAAEGAIGIFLGSDRKLAAMAEVNSETDFVAKGDDFAAFAQAIAACVAANQPADVAALNSLPLAKGSAQTVAQAREGLVSKLGENIGVRRFDRYATAQGHIASYVHGRKIGVLVEMQGGDENLARDIAMHIAASRPQCVSKDQVPAELVAKEREIYTARAADSGKPADIVEKMVNGQINKFLNEITLLGQPFVKNPDTTVEKLVQAAGARVVRFTRYEVGEGIEKAASDFAAEVMAQVKGS
jgi:elongation factor Ts